MHDELMNMVLGDGWDGMVSPGLHKEIAAADKAWEEKMNELDASATPVKGERLFTQQDLIDCYKEGHTDGMEDSVDIDNGVSPSSDPEKFFKEKFGINL